MFTYCAQAFGLLFIFSLLYVMFAECHACWAGEEERVAPKKIRFKGCATVFERIATGAALHNHIKR